MNNRQILRLFNRLLRRYERLFRGRIADALKNQYNDFLKNMNIDDVNAEELNEILQEMYLRAYFEYSHLISQNFKKEIKKQFNPSGMMGFSQELYNNFLSYFGIRILNQSQGITENTRKIISKIMIGSSQSGIALQEIVDKITSQSDMSEVRARLIARTELTSAANSGSWFSAQTAPIKMQKRWLSQIDTRTRDDHINVNGQTKEIDKPFIVGGHQMMFPGDKGGNGLPPVPAKEVCNCRCTMIYIPIRDGSGNLIPNRI